MYNVETLYNEKIFPCKCKTLQLRKYYIDKHVHEDADVLCCECKENMCGCKRRVWLQYRVMRRLNDYLLK